MVVGGEPMVRGRELGTAMALVSGGEGLRGVMGGN